jgi:hypothetical protein
MNIFESIMYFNLLIRAKLKQILDYMFDWIVVGDI